MPTFAVKAVSYTHLVAEEGADLARIENEIKTMPNYFADYDTTVHFISQEELDRDHSGCLLYTSICRVFQELFDIF